MHVIAHLLPVILSHNWSLYYLYSILLLLHLLFLSQLLQYAYFYSFLSIYFYTYSFYPNSYSTPTSTSFCPSTFTLILSIPTLTVRLLLLLSVHLLLHLFFLSQHLQFAYFYYFLSIHFYTYSFYPNTYSMPTSTTFCPSTFTPILSIPVFSAFLGQPIKTKHSIHFFATKSIGRNESTWSSFIIGYFTTDHWYWDTNRKRIIIRVPYILVYPVKT